MDCDPVAPGWNLVVSRSRENTFSKLKPYTHSTELDVYAVKQSAQCPICKPKVRGIAIRALKKVLLENLQFLLESDIIILVGKYSTF